MDRPCLHCEYDPNTCPEICQYGKDRKRLKELEDAQSRRLSLQDMETLKQRNKLLEDKWLELENIPFNPETEKSEAPFMHFPIGTDKEVIWHWFDERHSKGIVHLLYHEGIEHYPELQKLFHRRACCFNCDSETCALNPEGVCLYPLLYGNAPEWDDHDGCKGFLYKEG